MTIGVQSYPELYTLLIGWDIYGKIWDLLTQTGIAYLPFLGMLIKNFAKPYESQETRDAATTSLRRMQIDIFATILIIVLGVVPCFSLDPTMVSYTPVCQQNGGNNSYHPGDTGTTWDKAFSVPTDDIRVPVWWYMVLAVSEGITSSANTMVGCVPDLRKSITQVNLAQITDPTLKAELQQFNTDCYAAAQAQYYRDVQNNSNSSAVTKVQSDLQTYGVDDANWFGSHALQDAYYSQTGFKAQKTVVGFPYDATDDINADSDSANPPAYGTPDCYTWWNDSTNGLKTKLYNVMPKSFWDDVKGYFTDPDKQQDDVIKKLVQNADKGYTPANDVIGSGIYSHVMAGFGILSQQMNEYPKLYAEVEAAPIIQALLQMLIYVFLPLALVFSSYRAGSFVTGGIIIFSLIFWTFIWHLIGWADNTLMQALYGDSWFSKQSPSATLADFIIGALVIVAPLFWFSFMGTMGIAIGSLATSAFNGLNNPATDSAPNVTGNIKSAMNTVISAAKFIGGKIL